jgi:DNA-binding NarL/FixJ family response regulator
VSPGNQTEEETMRTAAGDIAGDLQPDAAPERAVPSAGRDRLAVAALLTDGLSYSEIAQKLAVSYHTSHIHIKAIHRKAGVSTIGRLAALLYGAGKESK